MSSSIGKMMAVCRPIDREVWLLANGHEDSDRFKALRTLITAFRLTGWNNLKKARRHFSHAMDRCIDLITKPVKTVKGQT